MARTRRSITNPSEGPAPKRTRTPRTPAPAADAGSDNDFEEEVGDGVEGVQGQGA